MGSAKAVIRAACAGAVLLTASAAGAMSYQLDSFSVTKEGALWFQDDFADGLAPPAGPAFIGTDIPGYTPNRVVGDFSGAESGGKLTLDPATRGVATVNPSTGQREGISFQGAYLNVNTDDSPQAADRGLKLNHSFAVTGLFDFVTPGPVRGLDSYGIRLADFGNGFGASERDDVLDLQVFQSVSTGRPRLQFMQRNLDEGSFVTLASVLLDPTAGDRILLSLTKPTAFDPTIVASFQYYAGGIAVGAETAFDTTAAAFNGERFTRPGFFAVSLAAPVLAPVPEPQTWALMLAGLCVIGALARRR